MRRRLTRLSVYPRIKNAKRSAGYGPHVQQQGKYKYCLGHQLLSQYYQKM